MNLPARIHAWLSNIVQHHGWWVALALALGAAGIAALVVWLVR